MIAQKQSKYISVLLVIIFSITIIPFGVFHRHLMDEHRIAIVSHAKGHFCEMDNKFCKDEMNILCGHERHLNNSLTKCFTCQFHFEKNFEPVKILSYSIFFNQFKEIFSYQTIAAIKAAQLISNKGPPSKMFIG